MDNSFRSQLLGYFDEITERVATDDGSWTVKGFIDVYQRVYTISLDTKVLSKVLELLLWPVLQRFADEHDYEIVPAPAQNQYPDLSLIAKRDPSACIALDIKTTYRTRVDREGRQRVNGMTLGTFGGYFRTRDRPVSSTFAYNRYSQHYILGIVYTRNPSIGEGQVYTVTDLEQIPSVASDFQIFLHEKFRLASDRPGSGNTKNIGSSTVLETLLTGAGVFAKLGLDVFDDYWMNYRTRAMARAEGFDEPPYNNLKTYRAFKQRGATILDRSDDELESDE